MLGKISKCGHLNGKNIHVISINILPYIFTIWGCQRIIERCYELCKEFDKTYIPD